MDLSEVLNRNNDRLVADTLTEFYQNAEIREKQRILKLESELKWRRDIRLTAFKHLQKEHKE